MPRSATYYAFTSIVLWSFLAYFGVKLSHLPPFLLVGIALCVCGLIGIVKLKEWRAPLKTYAVGIAGIFGYHFLYFNAFRYSPPVEVNLLNYLWPLLIVLLTPMYQRDHKLHSHHLIGAILGLIGAGLIISGGRISLNATHFLGYISAAGAAFVWANYSLMTKRLPPFPTSVVAGFCFFSGLLSLTCHFVLSPANEPLVYIRSVDWLHLLLLGAGPMGIAFFTWDASLKRGDPRIIGSLTYITPLLSTLVLVFIGHQNLTPITTIAMILIISGAVIGAWDLIRSPFMTTRSK